MSPVPGFGPSAVRWLASVCHGVGSRLRRLAMLKVFLDDSGKEADQAIVVVAGYVASAERWEAFERDWWAVLRDPAVDLPYFHMVDWEKGAKTFKDRAKWTVQARANLMGRLLPILDRGVEMGVATAVDVRDYRDVMIPERSFVEGTNLREVVPVGYCIATLLDRIAMDFLTEPPSERIAVVFEDGTDRLGPALDFATHVLKQNTWGRAFNRTIAKGSKEEFAPLHAADILAYETFQHVRAVGNDPTAPPQRDMLKRLLATQRISLKYGDRDNFVRTVEEFRDWLAR